MAGNNLILLAEDDEDDQALIQMALRRANYAKEIQIVNNGQEALDVLMNQRELPCLIILDLNMPMLDGIQTLQALTSLARFQQVPKVILTTSDSEENKEKSYYYGATDYFIKPNTLNELVATAQKILNYCK